MLLNKILRAGDAKTMRRIEKLADAVDILEPTYKGMSDDELKSCTQDFKNRLESGEEADHLIPETFAVAREASRRVLGKFPYRVQIIGGIALHLGNIAEMATGSGKALPEHAKIPTPAGWKTAGEIKVGDLLFSRTGQPTTVLGVYPQGRHRTYRLTLEGGRHVECNSEHLWAVHTSIDDLSSVDVLTTQEIVDRGGEGKFLLPATCAAEHAESQEILDPYEHGLNIGSWDTSSFLANYGSIQQRWEIVSGVAESCYKIFVDTSTGSPAYSVGLRLPSPEFVPVVTSLFYSLALPVKLKGDNELVFNFSPTIIDYLLGGNKIAPQFLSAPPERILSIVETSSFDEHVCFSVDNPEHIFLAGDYVPTHNTLTAVAPTYLNSLTGKGVHVVTTNDYLASTQQKDMGRVYSYLGVSSSVILNSYTPEQRREAYKSDITYGTNNEFGFDYLRDNLVKNKADKVQRGHNFIIVDEADSILIDDAKTPLIISGAPDENGSQATKWFTTFADFAEKMRRNRDYEVDFKKKTINILEPALDKVEDWLGIDNLYFESNSFLVSFLYNSIKAKELFRNGYEYIVRDKEVLIVDPSTGRTMPGRRYSDGLHQALEAKEKVPVQPESITTSSITLQSYVGLYDKVAGMTGTAYSEAAELMDIYGLGVIQVPNHRPLQRVEHEDSMFINENQKYDALLRDIVDRHKKGQPILIGTASVEKSERVSRELSRAGIKHEVLNANNHAREAAIIAQAGRKGAVTVATNMAGRGTDILLGGNPEFDAKILAENSGIDPVAESQKYNEFLQDAENRLSDEYASLKEEVMTLGGLYVVGTERHESRRIDDQLRGRSGRQGDPGESKFYLSLDDHLVERFGGSLVQSLKRLDPETEISSKTVSKIVRNVQGQIKEQDAEQRKNSMKYDEALSLQRESVYRDRDMILESESPLVLMRQLVAKAFDDLITSQVALKIGQRDIGSFFAEVKKIYSPGISPQEMLEEYGDIDDWDMSEVVGQFKEDCLNMIGEAEESIGKERLESIARTSLLYGYDSNYPLHLASLDYLKQGIGLRALAQKNPVHEYLEESNKLYSDFMKEVRFTSVHNFFDRCQQLRKVSGSFLSRVAVA